jgi:hypothetical protein
LGAKKARVFEIILNNFPPPLEEYPNFGLLVQNSNDSKQQYLN